MDNIKLTLLHSNDLHGDFLPEEKDGKMTGGLSRLAGYIRKVRKEEPNVIYAIAGDMFRGSIIDSEFMGMSTIDMINLLAPDVTTIGNHEVDYGLAHLLFLEKCASFPIVNANLYVTYNNVRLFQPYIEVKAGGLNILFIGVLTEEVLDSTRSEKVIGSYVDVAEAAHAVGVICDNYRTTRTDMTILLTHIGIEEDRKLASLLSPELGVDLIIGGHSHTYMEELEMVNGIPIVQAFWGTEGIGRFDIEYNPESRQMERCKWQYVRIDEDCAENDPLMEDLISRYKNQTDVKYKRVVTRLARKLTHPQRNMETEQGNLYADLMQDDSSFDIMLFASGSIRKPEIGPVMEFQDMMENTPFDGPVYMVKVNGRQFRTIVRHLLRDEAWTGHTEFYQFSKGVKIVYHKKSRVLESVSFRGKEVEDGDELLLGIQDYHYNNFDRFFGVPLEEVKENMRPRVVAVSINNIIEEYLSVHQGLDAKVEGRITLLED